MTKILEEKKTLARIFTERARSTPGRVYAVVPCSDQPEGGYRDLSYGELDQVVDRMAWWLDEKLGTVDKHRPGRERVLETLAYAGATDLRYAALLLAAIKSRRKVLLPLFMNSREAHLSLLGATNCRILLASEELLGMWQDIEDDVEHSQIITMPPWEFFTSDAEAQPYPYEEAPWDEIKYDVVHITQTSGTTGHPKPIEFTHIITTLLVRLDDPLCTNSKMVNKRFINPLPASWLLGLTLQIYFPLMLGTIPILMPSSAPSLMTAEYFDRVNQVVPWDAVLCIPALLKEISLNPEYVERMRGKLAMFGGAVLEREVGDKLSKVMDLQLIIGSTESGQYLTRPSDPEYWYSYTFSPLFLMKMVHFQDDLYEGVFIREEGNDSSEQIVFNIFPDLKIFHTKDLWRELEDKKGSWVHAGRTDDFLKLSNLTKFNAGQVEIPVTAHPIVKTAVVGGSARVVPFLLIEVRDEDQGRDEKELLDDIWPTVQNANASLSGHIRLEREMVLFTKPGKPIKKGGAKHVVQRTATMEEYEQEIEELYEQRGIRTNGQTYVNGD